MTVVAGGVSEGTPEGTRRILVALDASPGCIAVLEQAAALASEFNAELAGLFVEDINLFRLCDLPGHEVSLSGSATRRPAQAQLERELRAHAAHVRGRVEQVARARRVSWSFQVTRGHHEEAVLGAAREADLVALGRALRPLRHQHVVPRSRRQVTLQHLPPPVVAFYEGGEDGRRLLEIAVRAARNERAPILILVPARGAAQAETRSAAAQAVMTDRGVVSILRVVGTGRASIYKALAEARGRLLLLDAGGAAVRAGMLHDMMQEAGCEALLVAPLSAAGQDAVASSSSPT